MTIPLRGAPLAALLLLAALAPRPAAAQDLTVRTSLPADGWVDRDDRIEIAFDRPVDGPAERVAVFFDHTDVSGLFRSTAAGLVYDPGAPPLPGGEGELVVYLVTDAGWTEIDRQPLRVRGRLGFETSEWDPGLDVSLQGQVAAGEDPDPGDVKQVDQELSGQLALRTLHGRGGLSLVGETTLLGTTRRSNALRFAEKGLDAPKVDLSAYRVEVRQGPVSVQVGNVAFGDERQLIQNFDSRGTLLDWAPGGRVDVAFALLNGSNVVGWDHLLGVDQPDHRLSAGSIGIEAFDRPGALRMEWTWLDASVLPGRSGFNQGDVNDAETSNGMAFSVRGGTAGRRLAFEAGTSRSTYDNPVDPTLAQGDDLVPVERTTRWARYAEASIGILRNAPLGGDHTARLDLAVRHQRVDPQYRSIGAYARPDIEQNRVELRGDFAGVRWTASHDRSEDNLDRVASVLTTKTRRTAATVGVPAGPVDLGYRLDRTHQFGEGVPENSGFNESHVPDQVSLHQTADVTWRGERVTAGWRLDLSNQDNRQPGRENADLKGRVNAFQLGLRPWTRLSVDLGLDLERRESVERDEVENTRRWDVRATVAALDASQLALSFSTTHQEDDANTRERDDSALDLQWSSAIPGLSGIGGQYFLRLSWTASTALDRTFEIDDDTSRWRVDSGLNLTFF